MTGALPGPRRMRRALARRQAARAGDRIGPRFGGAPGGAVGAAVRLPVPGRARAGDGGRWGLVLGGGGVLGAAWLVGALEALEQVRGLDPRQADVILGTSAGSVVGTLLAAGAGVAELRAQQLGEPSPAGGIAGRLAGIAFDPEQPAGPALPPRPRLRPGSTALLRNNRGSLRAIPRTALLAALAPAGRGHMEGVARLMRAAVPGGGWPDHSELGVVALDYEAGRRVVFGPDSDPGADLDDAVLASCAIPGWFEPVTIDGRRYVDGGMWSSTNADLLAGRGLDEIVVLAPMASAAYDSPQDWRARVERRLRVASTRRCLAEAREVQESGTAVTVVGPGPEDLALMGYNLMAPARRRAVLESAVRTATAAFAGLPPRAVAAAALDPDLSDPSGRPGAPVAGRPPAAARDVSLDRPLLPIDANRSDDE